MIYIYFKEGMTMVVEGDRIKREANHTLVLKKGEIVALFENGTFLHIIKEFEPIIGKW